MTTENQQPRSIVPVVIGIGITAVFLLVLGYAAHRRAGEENAVPQLQLLSPVSAAVLDSPLVLRFASSRPLELSQSGWSAGNLHVHAWLNDVQHMPAAADIHKSTDGSYEWRVADVPRGPATVRLGWADMQHRPIAAGSTPTISFVVR